MPAIDFDQAVHGALGAIADFLGVDRAELIEVPAHGGTGNSWSLLGATDMTLIPWLISSVP